MKQSNATTKKKANAEQSKRITKNEQSNTRSKQAIKNQSDNNQKTIKSTIIHTIKKDKKRRRKSTNAQANTTEQKRLIDAQSKTQSTNAIKPTLKQSKKQIKHK